MLKLNYPAYSCKEAIDHCRQSISVSNSLLQRVSNSANDLENSSNDYTALASKEELYTINPTPQSKGRDPVIIGQLKKSDLNKLYSRHFAKSGKPSRRIYDSLIASAEEKCPYCGGIGRPRNLDHYLPKGHFPQFSILPVNLIPSCRDCNMGSKREYFATCMDKQTIHPYLDNERYFCEQWISAKYFPEIGNEPGFIQYFVDPPEHWTSVQKSRVERHFHEFKLGNRFSLEAGPRLITLLAQIKRLTDESLNMGEAKDVILQPIINRSLFPNHWEKVMCLALKKDLV